MFVLSEKFDDRFIFICDRREFELEELIVQTTTTTTTSV